jgi:hypothetical protein
MGRFRGRLTDSTLGQRGLIKSALVQSLVAINSLNVSVH